MVLVGLSSVSGHHSLWAITEEAQEEAVLVLSCLAEAGLKIDPNKCKLLSEQVVVLGNAVSRDTYIYGS